MITTPRQGQMAVVSLAARRRQRTVRKLRGVLARLAQPARPVLANLVKIPLTVAGLVCVDVGVFTANVVAGWLVTGASLIVLEHLIADED